MASAREWGPTADLATLRRRARLLAGIRAFFARRDVLEVETPTLSAAATPDPHVPGLRLDHPQNGARHLHTSPEFPMKRLLAAGLGSIYQLGRAYRADEAGRHHNPEFTLLEWYREGWGYHRLMGEVGELVTEALAGVGRSVTVTRITYREAFRLHAGIDPFREGAAQLEACARDHGIRLGAVSMARDDWLDLLMAEVVSAGFVADGLTLVHDYPASQAALARIRPGPPAVAERFEAYWGKLELANGFQELTDADEQARRFRAEQAEREALGHEPVPVDHRFLAALEAGMPESAGVALGVDRLLMAMLDCQDIREVLAFPVDRA